MTKLESLLDHAPDFTLDEAVALAEDLFGIRTSASELPSERDQNFLLVHKTQQFVLKIANGLEGRSLLLAQNAAMSHLSSKLCFCQRVILTKYGKELEEVDSDHGKHFVRLVSYLPGVSLGDLADYSPPLLRDLGFKLGQLDLELLEFDHPGIHRSFHWDLANWRSILEQYLPLVTGPQLQQTIKEHSSAFESDIAPLLSDLRRSCVHGDPNDYNVLVDAQSASVTGLIDFGDMVYSYTITDLAVALAYIVLKAEDPIRASVNVVNGYHQALPLAQNELEVTWPLTLMRLCMSVCLAAHQQRQQPGNEYLAISQQAIRESLPRLMAIDRQQARDALLDAIN